jgi:hypothetical protein
LWDKLDRVNEDTEEEDIEEDESYVLGGADSRETDISDDIENNVDILVNLIFILSIKDIDRI